MKRISILYLIMIGICSSCQPVDQHASSNDLNNKGNELIIDLNQFTYSIANEHDQFYSFIGVRALAMVHLAIHDIFMSAESSFLPYYWKEPSHDIHPLAAAISSTKLILSTTYPDRKDTINNVCRQLIEGLADTTFLSNGVVFGNKVAASYLLLRNNDGHEKRGNYTPMTKPGDYQYTPGFDWVLKPDFTLAKPFAIDSVTQFRSPSPPPLESAAYAEAYNEVKTYGSKNSRLRSDDETNYAHWWAEFGEHSWNRIGRITAREKRLSIVETNRMFALWNMTLYDLYLASLESKYFYDTWRPLTAIKNGDNDQNELTEGNLNWEPEMINPPWPEYPSAHAATGAAGAVIIASVYSTLEVEFTMNSVTALPSAEERTYTHLDSAANDCANSRIMNGYHFRFATEEGQRQGKAIAQFVIDNSLTRITQ